MIVRSKVTHFGSAVLVFNYPVDGCSRLLRNVVTCFSLHGHRCEYGRTPLIQINWDV